MGSTVLFTALVVLLAPADALADIYKWTDERGVTVLSSLPPEDPGHVRNVEVLAKETKRAKGASAAATYEEGASSDQILLDRIESLERQLRAQQYPREVVSSPPASQAGYYTTPYQGGYYSTPPPLPHWVEPAPYYPGYYAYPGPYVTFYPAVTTVFPRAHGHFRYKHFPHVFPRSTFPRSFVQSGFPRGSPDLGSGTIGSTHRGRR